MSQHGILRIGSGLWCPEYVTKRTEKPSFLRPVGDGEESMGKHPAKFVFESIAEVQSGVPGIVAEGSTAPRAENEGFVTSDAGY